jgi:hypothetical protein
MHPKSLEISATDRPLAAEPSQQTARPVTADQTVADGPLPVPESTLLPTMGALMLASAGPSLVLAITEGADGSGQAQQVVPIAVRCGGDTHDVAQVLPGWSHYLTPRRSWRQP